MVEEIEKLEAACLSLFAVPHCGSITGQPEVIPKLGLPTIRPQFPTTPFVDSFRRAEDPHSSPAVGLNERTDGASRGD
jgi:hypothetical protein